MTASQCAALDARSVVLVTKLGVLEDKLRKLQSEVEGTSATPAAPASAASAAASSAGAASAHAAHSASAEAAQPASAAAAAAAESSASAHTPAKNSRILPKLKYKKEKPAEQNGIGTTTLAAAGAVAVAVLGGLGWFLWKRRKEGKSNAPLKIWQGWRKKKPAPEPEPEPAPPLEEVTPESLLEPE